MSPPQLQRGRRREHARDAVRPRPGPAVRTSACHQATGGNPFFVRELAAALIADEVIEPADDAAARIAAAAPATIARTTLARLGRLSPRRAADLARAIAVLGPDARLPRAASLAGLDERRALHARSTRSARRMSCRAPARSSFAIRSCTPRSTTILRRVRARSRTGGPPRCCTPKARTRVSWPVTCCAARRSAPARPSRSLRDAARHALVLGAPETAADYLLASAGRGPGARELRAAGPVRAGAGRVSWPGAPSAARALRRGFRRLAEDPTLRAQSRRPSRRELLWYSGEWEQGMALLDAALVEFGDRYGDDVVIVAETLRAEDSRRSFRVCPATSPPGCTAVSTRWRRAGARAPARWPVAWLGPPPCATSRPIRCGRWSSARLGRRRLPARRREHHDACGRDLGADHAR